MLRALTKNQVLLLNEVEKNSTKTITSLVNKVSKKQKIPVSTLKLNARNLRQLGLIDHSLFEPVSLTNLGKLVFKIVTQDSSIGRVRGRNPRDPDSNSGPETFDRGESR